VAHYIDFVVNAAGEYAPEMQKEWKGAVAWLADKKVDAAFVGGLAENFPPYRLIKQMTVFAFYTSRAGLVGDLGYQGIAYLKEFPECNHPEHRRV
jgi:hypothetical protein